MSCRSRSTQTTQTKAQVGVIFQRRFRSRVCNVHHDPSTCECGTSNSLIKLISSHAAWLLLLTVFLWGFITAVTASRMCERVARTQRLTQLRLGRISTRCWLERRTDDRGDKRLPPRCCPACSVYMCLFRFLLIWHILQTRLFEQKSWSSDTKSCKLFLLRVVVGAGNKLWRVSSREVIYFSCSNKHSRASANAGGLTRPALKWQIRSAG